MSLPISWKPASGLGLAVVLGGLLAHPSASVATDGPVEGELPTAEEIAQDEGVICREADEGEPRLEQADVVWLESESVWTDSTTVLPVEILTAVVGNSGGEDRHYRLVCRFRIGGLERTGVSSRLLKKS